MTELVRKADTVCMNGNRKLPLCGVSTAKESNQQNTGENPSELARVLFLTPYPSFRAQLGLSQVQWPKPYICYLGIKNKEKKKGK